MDKEDGRTLGSVLFKRFKARETNTHLLLVSASWMGDGSHSERCEPNLHSPTSDSTHLCIPSMGCWQTTFTLSSRTKGCHLVTNEVSGHIQEGLKGVKVCFPS